ncbi:carboxypeptidase-like regulatory domain-containing protein [Fibrobacterota bacterium]
MIRILRMKIAFTAAVAFWPVLTVFAQEINISGRVVNTSDEAIAGASVELETAGLTAITGADGSFSLTSATAVYLHQTSPQKFLAAIRSGQMSIKLTEKSQVSISTFSLDGRTLSTEHLFLDAGTHSLALPRSKAGVYLYKVKSGENEVLLKGSLLGGFSPGTTAPFSPVSLAKQATAAQSFNDALTSTADGYLDYRMTITNPDTSDLEIVMIAEDELQPFSFFVTSLGALQELADSEDGFGGDLRFGETGPGAGLRGADKLCETIAERSMPGSSAKGWRAFLSISEDEDGQQVDAIDRIGEGPWYDRLGRLLAPTINDLLNDRPENGDPTIQNDLTNEDGVPNHQPDPNQPEVDNHHFITGSDEDGTLYSQDGTCEDWTSDSEDSGRPRYGFSWPRRGFPKAAQGGMNGSHWISGGDAPGCAAGIELVQSGPAPPGSVIIGGGGGYGGFYCFALNP